MKASPPDTKFIARTRGQVMVLGCVALLVMALMLMASYSVSNSVYEKMRVQSHADAQAYSVAIVEARALNITAHFNRAIAAALVAQMSLHSWMAIATADVAMLQAGQQAMLAIAAFEAAQHHYPCAALAKKDAAKFGKAYKTWSDTLEGLESKFNDGVAGITEMVSSLHTRQRAVLTSAKGEVVSSGAMLSALKKTNASRSEYITAFDGMNTADFACALEGSDFDGECGGDRQRGKASQGDRSKVIENAANAARTKFDVNAAEAASLSDENFTKSDHKVPKDQLSEGEWTHEFTTTSRVGEGTNGNSNPGDEAKNVGAEAVGGTVTVSNYRHAPPTSMPFTAQIFSDSMGGTHTPVHEGTHDKFKGVNQEGDPCGDDVNCFVNYRALPDPKKDFGFPTTYGGVTQDIRLLKGKGGESATYGDRSPWDLNEQRKVKIELVKGEPATIDYTARNEGKAYAISKGKVYFHQLGNWQVAPNLFDPFWRAKLHFFGKDEFRAVLEASGDEAGLELNGAGAPVEGEDEP